MKMSICDIPSNSILIEEKLAVYVSNIYFMQQIFIAGLCPALVLQQLLGRQSVRPSYDSPIKEKKHRALPSCEFTALCYNLLSLVILYVLYPHNTSPLVCEISWNKNCDLIKFVPYLYWVFSKYWSIVQIMGWSPGEKIRMCTPWEQGCFCLFCSLLSPQG